VVIDRGKKRRWLAYGLGVVGLGLETTMVIYNLHKKDLGEQEPQNAQKFKDDIRYKGTALFAGGVLALGAAAYLYITAPGKETLDQTARLTPVIGPDQLGMAFGGRF